ncbi:MAG: RNA polymerase sigma-70 factor [Bacteroidales bacterium]|nr:RNA polymerase sigma-70 factor [Bacteroidales bacterium]
MLISELKKDSQEALDSIYKMYAKRLYAFCLQYTKSKENAEEIVEDVFVWIWVNRCDIHQEETLRSLLFIRAKHYLINAYRSRINSPVYEDYVNYQDELAADDIQQHLEYEDFVRQLRNALTKLPITQQQVIELSKIQQVSNKEIAIKLSLSEQTVKNQLSLGLKNLRKELNKVPFLFWLLFFVN